MIGVISTAVTLKMLALWFVILCVVVVLGVLGIGTLWARHTQKRGAKRVRNGVNR